MDIFLKRECILFFISELGEGNSALKYFNDDITNKFLSVNFNNSTKISLNEYFYNMKNDKLFQKFMSKVVEKYK